jgi:hypothetical protein
LLRDLPCISGGGSNAPVADDRIVLLQKFAQALAARPFLLEDLAKARHALLAGFTNNELLLEAAACGAFFEAVTKVVDATNRVPMSALEATIISQVFAVVAFFYNILVWCRSWL